MDLSFYSFRERGDAPIGRTLPGLSSLKEKALRSTSYRKVLETSETLQLAIMNIPPGKEIPQEEHPATQFIYVVSGHLSIDKGKGKIHGFPGSYAWIEPDQVHTVTNESKVDDLVIFTLYSPPQHASGLEETEIPE